MKLLIAKVIFFVFIGQAIFAQKTSHVLLPPPVLADGYPDYINFCELANHKNMLVYTRFIYSGVDEYWSLTTPDEKCNANIHAELEIPDQVNIEKKYLDKLKFVHDNYWKNYLIIDAIGVYDDTAPGYGHLGHNKSQFTIKQIFSIQVAKK